MTIKIKDIMAGMSKLDVEGELTYVAASREVLTKSGPTDVANAIIQDDSGSMEISLWGKHAHGFEPRDHVEVKNGYSSSFKGRVQLNVGKFGTVREI